MPINGRTHKQTEATSSHYTQPRPQTVLAVLTTLFLDLNAGYTHGLSL